MRSFQAIRFDGKKSSGTLAEVFLLENDRIEIREEQKTDTFNLSECHLEAPIARVRRIFQLPDGSQLETDELALFDELFRQQRNSLGMRLVYWLEERWKWVGVCVIGLICSVVAAFIWGIPAAARVVAHMTPIEWNEALGEGVMEALDQYFMDPTEIPAEDLSPYYTWFEELKEDFPGDHNLTIHFRNSPLGPNALALPDGSIVVTDSLIELMDGRQEFEAVIVHEFAHVINRHALQMVLRDVGIFIFVSVLVGDASSITSLTAALPYMLVENGYSRKIESEADIVSGEWLQENYGSTEAMKSILKKLYEANGDVQIPELMSTHPDLEKRILQLEKRFPGESLVE